jgi:hypothetical protein
MNSAHVRDDSSEDSEIALAVLIEILASPKTKTRNGMRADGCRIAEDIRLSYNPARMSAS